MQDLTQGCLFIHAGPMPELLQVAESTVRRPQAPDRTSREGLWVGK